MDKEIAANLVCDIREGINGFLIQELRAHGVQELAPSHGAILPHLFDHGQVTMKNLAKAVRRDKSTVTALVGKLVLSGYVERSGSQHDQRAVLVFLTPRGLALEPVFREISSKLAQRLWRGFSESEIEETLRLLDKVKANFR